MCYLCLDPMMISNLVLVGADDKVDDFKEPRARGR